MKVKLVEELGEFITILDKENNEIATFQSDEIDKLKCSICDLLDFLKVEYNKSIRPMLMQINEPEYMCTECGYKFYVYGYKPISCAYCGSKFDWSKEIAKENLE